MSTTPPVYTTGDIARRYGVEVWQVRRLYERKMLPPGARAGTYRVVTEAELPAVEDALRRAGYLPTEEACPA